MLGLAIDSANQTATAALWRDARPGPNVDPKSDADCGAGADFGAPAVLASEALPPETVKADQLILVIERLLREQGLGYQDLDMIAVNRGPGSFTGIRSAVALVRGLALAAGLPVLGVTSHEAIAAGLGHDPVSGKTMIVLDARRGEVYAQAFAADGHPRGEIEAKAPALVAAALSEGRWRLAGSGAALVAAQLADDRDVEIIETPPVDAGMVMLAAAGRLSAGETPAPGFALKPLYVRAPDAVPPTPLISKSIVSEVLI
ncbi:MAG: tRNA (adenosine(37)-N6)-threonylcarbamoyltransferase complex dimerization subunit type 1 TsaB [Geminicoccaceae bacterium]